MRISDLLSVCLRNLTRRRVRTALTIIGVVIGGVILAGLYALFNTTIMPTVTSKVTELFNYQG